MPKKKRKPLNKLERKLRRKIIWNRILVTIVLLGILGLAAGSTAIYTIIKSCSIDLNVSDFKSSENTIIYDRNGEEITRVGIENRVTENSADRHHRHLQQEV